jgi:hypothetical protein
MQKCEKAGRIVAHRDTEDTEKKKIEKPTP